MRSSVRRSCRDPHIAEWLLDGATLHLNENAIRKNVATSVMQGAEAMVEYVRGFFSPWPLKPADMARVEILIFNGKGARVIPPSAGQESKAHVAPNAILFPPFEDMGHMPALKHYKRIFEELGKLLRVERSKAAAPRRLESAEVC